MATATEVTPTALERIYEIGRTGWRTVEPAERERLYDALEHDVAQAVKLTPTGEDGSFNPQDLLDRLDPVTLAYVDGLRRCQLEELPFPLEFLDEARSHSDEDVPTAIDIEATRSLLVEWVDDWISSYQQWQDHHSPVDRLGAFLAVQGVEGLREEIFAWSPGSLACFHSVMLPWQEDRSERAAARLAAYDDEADAPNPDGTPRISLREFDIIGDEIERERRDSLRRVARPRRRSGTRTPQPSLVAVARRPGCARPRERRDSSRRRAVRAGPDDDGGSDPEPSAPRCDACGAELLDVAPRCGLCEEEILRRGVIDDLGLKRISCPAPDKDDPLALCGNPLVGRQKTCSVACRQRLSRATRQHEEAESRREQHQREDTSTPTAGRILRDIERVERAIANGTPGTETLRRLRRYLFSRLEAQAPSFSQADYEIWLLSRVNYEVWEVWKQETARGSHHRRSERRRVGSDQVALRTRTTSHPVPAPGPLLIRYPEIAEIIPFRDLSFDREAVAA